MQCTASTQRGVRCNRKCFNDRCWQHLRGTDVIKIVKDDYEVLIFPLDPDVMTFSIKNEYGMYDLEKPNWKSADSATDLSIAFNTQLIQFLLQLNYMTSLCDAILYEDDDSIKLEIPLVSVRDKKTEELKKLSEDDLLDLHINDRELTQQTCEKYMDMRESFDDVMSRDEDFIMTSKRGKIPIYVIVVLDKNGFYMGHVYSWLSPLSDSNLFMMGIRSSPLMPFLRNKGKGIKNIANIMLDSLETFRESIGAQNIIIPHPIGVMRKILKTSGYSEVKNIINKRDIGDLGILTYQLVDRNGVCDDCFIKSVSS